VTLLAQISDLHLRAGGLLACGRGDALRAARETLGYLLSFRPSLDALVLTGDLADRGEEGAYLELAELLRPFEIPLGLVPGNHDDRERAREIFGGLCPWAAETYPFLCWTRDLGKVGLIGLDVAQEGRVGGALAGKVANFLEKALSAFGERDCLVFLHQPPFRSGLGDMDGFPFVNAGQLSEIMGAYPRAVLACGHLHRGLASFWEGGRAICAPPVCLHMELDLTEKGGHRFTLGPPGFALYHYGEGLLNVHFASVPGDYPYAGPYYFSGPPAG
jgi:3',5'-cyclic AMP phosphodiesterase CpdA